MSANDLYSAALSLMGIPLSKAGGYTAFVLPLLNQLLARLFEINNACRQADGLSPLIDIPLLASMGDEIPYDKKLARDALPWGLAALLCVPDDKASFNWFNFEFAARVERYSKAVSAPINEVI